MANTYQMPEKLRKCLFGLAKEDWDTTGLIFYRKAGTRNGRALFHLDAALRTGLGKLCRFESCQGRVDAADTYLRENTYCKALPFHTHTFKTVRNLGGLAGSDFTKPDLERIAKEQRKDGDYEELLITPDTMKLGTTKGSMLEWVADSSSSNYHADTILKAIKAIAERARYDMTLG